MNTWQAESLKDRETRTEKGDKQKDKNYKWIKASIFHSCTEVFVKN